MLTKKYLLAALLLISTPIQAVEVINTVKPIQLIALAIMQGTKQPQQLLSSHSSPHDYQMRPSDMRKLQSADIVFWVGPSLEKFLVNTKQARQPKTHWIELQALFEGGDDVEKIEHADDEGVDKEALDHDEPQDHHGHDGLDPHIWLSPKQTALIAKRMASVLVKVDPSRSDTYRINLENFLTRLADLDHELKMQLAGVKDKGYFVFHDAYGYFEQHYGLNHLGAFTLSPDRKPGAKRLRDIRQQLESSEVHCVFTEPQFKPAIVREITDGLNINTDELDPLATSITPSPNGYFLFLQQLAAAYTRCL